jgi:hypothetical protein
VELKLHEKKILFLQIKHAVSNAVIFLGKAVRTENCKIFFKIVSETARKHETHIVLYIFSAEVYKTKQNVWERETWPRSFQSTCRYGISDFSGLHGVHVKGKRL